MSGLTLETAWLTPVAALQLALVAAGGGLVFGRVPAATAVLATAGIGTALPLLLFAAAARRLPLTVAGFLKYLTPVLQLLVGVLLLHEAMPPGRLAGFCLVWLALVLLVADGARRARRTSGARPLPA